MKFGAVPCSVVCHEIQFGKVLWFGHFHAQVNIISVYMYILILFPCIDEIISMHE